ncbi:glutathione S-transferase family protein [Gammaproteobacteria bacterium]|nr:glutathione S-transferase family protein [Gammaproteobacteria bacterium]
MEEFDKRLEAARNELNFTECVTVQNQSLNTTPRFEIWHWGFSLCSQKVRAVLTEKNLPYRSNELSFKNFENYNPGYVRLRMFAAGSEKLNKLASKHTMRTSVKTEGFDACVVPLLVDHKTRDIIVDSAEIIKYIDREEPQFSLMPQNSELEQFVNKQITINDNIPHPGILYGFHKNDPRPDFYIKIMEGIYDRKRIALEALIDEFKNDTELVHVYKTKIIKEMAGKKLQKDHSYMAQILNEFRDLILQLDKDLSEYDGPWICGNVYTMADCLWAISLYRIQWLGHASLWANFQKISEYAAHLYSRPALQKAFINWPGPMPSSPHTIGINTHVANDYKEII